ncbi:hypothetical protein BH23ACT12_BH23ACT12_22470 [soil metagenome]
MCADCYVVLEAFDEGQVEECPRCGKVMEAAELIGGET